MIAICVDLRGLESRDGLRRHGKKGLLVLGL